MTDLTMTPMIVNSFLTILIISDFLTGRWSIFTSITLAAFVTWNGLLLYLTYGPQKPPLTITETINKYPELWGWYFSGDWAGFWELNRRLRADEEKGGNRLNG